MKLKQGELLQARHAVYVRDFNKIKAARFLQEISAVEGFYISTDTYVISMFEYDPLSNGKSKCHVFLNLETGLLVACFLHLLAGISFVPAKELK
jgi:hypothetical protein